MRPSWLGSKIRQPVILLDLQYSSLFLCLMPKYRAVHSNDLRSYIINFAAGDPKFEIWAGKEKKKGPNWLSSGLDDEVLFRAGYSSSSGSNDGIKITCGGRVGHI